MAYIYYNRHWETVNRELEDIQIRWKLASRLSLIHDKLTLNAYKTFRYKLERAVVKNPERNQCQSIVDLLPFRLLDDDD